MKNIILSVLIISIAALSCKKNDNPPSVEPPVQYMSLTAGSTWNYETIDSLTAPATVTPYTITSTSRDSAIVSKSYHIFTNSNGSANQYYNITGNDYYNYMNLPATFGGSSVEYLYLKDNVDVGQSWSQSYPVTASGYPLNVTLTNTISEKGISKTVKGVAYSNVIHITTTLVVTIGGLPLPAGALTTDIESFYAPKFGMIQSVNKINLNFSGITDNTNQQVNLNSADIK